MLFGARRTRRECNQLSDADLSEAQNLIAEMSRKWEQLPVLTDSADAVYSVPESAPVDLTHRGLSLDEIEDLLPKSAAYRQAARILTVYRSEIKGRPLTPLNGGHVARCAVAGLLDGVFGSGEDRHIATWRSAFEVITEGSTPPTAVAQLGAICGIESAIAQGERRQNQQVREG